MAAPVETEALDWPPWVKDFVLPFVAEDGMRPVLFALLGHVAVIIAPAILFLLRDQNLFAATVLLLAGAGTIRLVRFEHLVRGSVGPVFWTSVAVWVSSSLLAWVVDYTGVF